MELSTRTRRAIATVLAVTLAIESVTAVLAAAGASGMTHALPADPPAGQVLAADSQAEAAPTAPDTAPATRVIVVTPRPVTAAIPAYDRAAAVADAAAAVAAAADAARAERQAARQAARQAERQAQRERREQREQARRERAAAREARAAAAANDRDGGAKPGKGGSNDRDATPEYRGRNHVWIPELGINKSVAWFPCDRQRPPDNYMYRWGCAGHNNVYLMGHAHSVMEPLHDAYVSGRLHKGMKVWYADNDGRVRVYAVRWWKTTKPTTDAAWAWAAQDVPSMTLQTCVGRNSQYRLMVRLTEAG